MLCYRKPTVHFGQDIIFTILLQMFLPRALHTCLTLFFILLLLIFNNIALMLVFSTHRQIRAVR